jgi:hypothetical protein
VHVDGARSACQHVQHEKAASTAPQHACLLSEIFHDCWMNMLGADSDDRIPTSNSPRWLKKV